MGRTLLWEWAGIPDARESRSSLLSIFLSEMVVCVPCGFTVAEPVRVHPVLHCAENLGWWLLRRNNCSITSLVFQISIRDSSHFSPLCFLETAIKQRVVKCLPFSSRTNILIESVSLTAYLRKNKS